MAKRKIKKRLKYEDRLKQGHKNREKLFAKLDKKTAAFARREFAKLGLY